MVDTVVFVTTGTAYAKPADFPTGVNNNIVLIGAGQGGQDAQLTCCGANPGDGGVGGSWAKKSNLTLASSTTIAIGAGSSNGASPAAGGDTTFDTGPSIRAKGGSSASTNIGDSSNVGGGKGTNGAGFGSGGGGGGAGGPNGAGIIGATPGGTNGGSGGRGDGTAGGLGGVGGAGDGPAGSAGAEYTSNPGGATAGSGGGGAGGANQGLGHNGGNGGNYGAGGGGASTPALKTGGIGANGLMVVTYTPVVSTAVGSMMRMLLGVG